jgi:hypothetical protein
MAALFKTVPINKPCEVDPKGGEVCLPAEEIPGGDIVINWSGRGKAARRYFRETERKLSGFDFKRVSKKDADLVISGAGRKAAKDALVWFLVEDGCCEQYTVFQQNDWLDAAAELGIMVFSDLSDAPGAPK